MTGEGVVGRIVGARRTAASRGIVGLLLAAAALVAAAPAGADEFDPVRLEVTAPAVARLDRPLAVTVAVAADPGALDHPDGPLRIRVKLAPECGGSFAGTQGPALLDRTLAPQPAPGQAYRAIATGTGSPAAYGVQSVCVFLESSADERQYVTDIDTTVDVSHRCTTDARRLTHATSASKHSRRQLTSARRRLRRASSARTRAHLRARVHRVRRTAVRRQKAVRRYRRAASRACGPDVAL